MYWTACVIRSGPITANKRKNQRVPQIPFGNFISPPAISRNAPNKIKTRSIYGGRHISYMMEVLR